MATITKTIVAIEFEHPISDESAKKLAERVREELAKEQPVLVIPDGGRLVSSPVHYGSE
ncbi:hypothetical protein ACXIUS_29445 [Bosea thiooxidans]